jgi:Na+/proline symporter
MAATTVNDFYAKYFRPDADERTLMRVSRPGR